VISRLAGLWRTHREVVLVACAIAAVALAVVVIWPITDLIAAHDVGTITGPLRALRLQTAREAVRTQLLTLGAGLFAAGALVYTARNFALTRRTVELTEQGQVTDRYTKAIEQLGSDKLDVRIGSIYALERVARDSARDFPTVMEVLSAFIREHSHDQALTDPDVVPDELGTPPDVQAAVTVVGRRDPDCDIRQIKLNGARLIRADLTSANLTGANLTGARLTGARLVFANLTGAIINDADLTEADLYGADLSLANLYGTNFAGANLTGANLANVSIDGADLTNARGPLVGPVPDGWQLDAESRRFIREEIDGAHPN
jgi:Pentapeptide repeats (8 copies)